MGTDHVPLADGKSGRRCTRACCRGAKLTLAELDAMRRLDWTPELRAVVQMHDAGIRRGVAAGLELARAQRTAHIEGDAVAWIAVLGERAVSSMYLRTELAGRLADLPQAGAWIAALGQPAPPGCCWLFVTTDGTGAILEPYRVGAPIVPASPWRLLWTPRLLAEVQVLGPTIKAALERDRAAGQLDQVAWIVTSGPAAEVYVRPRALVLQELRRQQTDALPQAGEWIDRLNTPAPAGEVWIFATNGTKAALVEPFPIAGLVRQAATA